jgi:hypothetical protein
MEKFELQLASGGVALSAEWRASVPTQTQFTPFFSHVSTKRSRRVYDLRHSTPSVVSYEDDVDKDEVRSVDKTEVRAGYGNDNPKTKG